MTLEQAHALVTADSYIEYYAGQYIVVPFAPVIQPPFFQCHPTSRTR